MAAVTTGGGGGGASALKFVGSDSDGLPLKRKQVQQACTPCRKKKKRCTHTSSATSQAPPSPPPTAHTTEPSTNPRAPSPAARSEPEHPVPPPYERDAFGHDEDSCQVAATQLVELSSRFVGDLNPEGLFIEATAHHSAKKETSADQTGNKIGIWLPAGSEADRAADTGRSPNPSSAYRHGHFPLSRPMTNHHQNHQRPTTSWSSPPSELALAFERARARYLDEECLRTLPPKSDYDVLARIFMDKIHPILPIFPDADLAGANPDPVYSTLLKQLIALTAGMDRAARCHLRLSGDGGTRDTSALLAPQDFHQRLASAVVQVLDAGWVKNKVDEVRILVLLALFVQPSGPSDRDRASRLSGLAVHHLQNMSAHLDGYRPQRADENIDLVFCAVWAVDRLVCTTYARPVVWHDGDVERDLETAIDKQPPCYRLFLKIVLTLDRVLPMYKPRGSYRYTDVPVFESLIIETGTGKTPTNVLATLETLYHTVSVLSCRQPRSAFSDSAADNDRSHLPDSSINPRRSLSADRIVWAVKNEDLAPFPFVPYAVSLALSVQYRKMRYSKTIMFRNRARAMFQDIVRVLARMGDVFYSAKVNAGLGESILREMEKTATSLTRDERDEAHLAVTSASSSQGAPMSSGALPDRSRASTDASGAVAVTADGGGLTDASTVGGELTPMSPAVFPSTNAVAPGYDGHSDHLSGASALAVMAGGGVGGGVGGGNLEPSSVFDSLDIDIDLFGYFDPNFDLGAVDTALEANLNIGFPAVTWAGQASWNVTGGG